VFCKDTRANPTQVPFVNGMIPEVGFKNEYPEDIHQKKCQVVILICGCF
jgi:hypothetical protein